MFKKLLLPLLGTCSVVSAQVCKQNPVEVYTEPDPAAQVSLRPHAASCNCIVAKGTEWTESQLPSKEKWLDFMGVELEGNFTFEYNPYIEDIYNKEIIPVLLSPDYPFRAFLDEAKTKSQVPQKTNAAACQIAQYLSGIPLEVYATQKNSTSKASTEFQSANRLQIGVNLPVWRRATSKDTGKRSSYIKHPDKEFCTTLAHEFGHAFVLANFQNLNFYKSPTNLNIINDITIERFLRLAHESFAEYITYLSYNSYFIPQHNSYTELQKAKYVLNFLESSLEKNDNPHGLDTFYVFSVLVFLKAENEGPDLLLKYDFDKLVEYDKMLQAAKGGNKTVLPVELRSYIDWPKFVLTKCPSLFKFVYENQKDVVPKITDNLLKPAIEKSLDHIKNHLGGKVPQKCYESDNIIERITFGKR